MNNESEIRKDVTKNLELKKDRFIIHLIKVKYSYLRVYFCLLICIFCYGSLFGQRDSLLFDEGKHLIGEVGSMNKGVLTIDVEFGDDDFKIEWDKVRGIYSETKFLIATKDRARYNGTLKGTADSVQIIDQEYGSVWVQLNDIVYLDHYDTKFKDRFSASIDIGLSLTKANNLKQFNSRSSLGYDAANWNLGGSINSVISEQDDQEERTSRTDASLTFRYIFDRGWFLFPEVLFLASNELNLDLRTIAKAGAGKYIFRTNKAFWIITGGFSRTLENFSNDQPNRNSWEAFIGTDLDVFNLGDLNFLLSADAYPSLTESGRFRSDIKFDIKYDLPLDFYISLGTTYNYDNQPAEGGSTSDYVVQTGIGWEF